MMVADDRLADGKPHPGAVARLLGGKEWIEHSGGVLRRNTRAGILELDFQHSRFAIASGSRANMQSAPLRRHRVDRVHRKVHKHLLKLARVALGDQRFFAKIGRHRDMAARSLGLHQAPRVADELANVAQRAMRLSAAPVVEKHPNDSRYAIDLADDYFESLARPLRNRLSMQYLLGPPPDDAHRRPDLMGEPRSQRADGSQPLGVLQAAFELQLAAMPGKEVAPCDG